MTAQHGAFCLRPLGALSRTWSLSDPALVDLLRLLDISSRTPRADHVRWCRSAGVDPERVGTVAAPSKRALCRLLRRVGRTGSYRVDRVTAHLEEWQGQRLASWWRGEVLFLFPEHLIRGDEHASRRDRAAQTPWRWWDGADADPTLDDGPIDVQTELPLGASIDRHPIDPAIADRSDRFYIGTEEDEREPSRAGAREPADPAFDELAARVVRSAVGSYELTEDAADRLRALVDEHGVAACHAALDRGESLRTPVGWLRATLARGPLVAELPPETEIEARIRGCIPLRDGRPAVIRLDAESRAQIAALVEAHGEEAIRSLVPEAGSCDLPVQRIQQALADRASAQGEGPAWKAQWRARQARELGDRAAVRAAAKARRRRRAEERAEASPTPATSPASEPVAESAPDPVEVVEDPEAAAEWARRLPTLRANFPSMSALVSTLVAVGMQGADVVLDGPSEEMFWVAAHRHIVEAAGAVLRGFEAAQVEPTTGDERRSGFSRRIDRDPEAQARGLAKLRAAGEFLMRAG